MPRRHPLARSHDRFSLILASASPRRRLLLRKLKVPFRVLPSHVSERTSHKHPVRFVRELALRKAKATAHKLEKGMVLGADTVVVLRGRILGKPRGIHDGY